MSESVSAARERAKLGCILRRLNRTACNSEDAPRRILENQPVRDDDVRSSCFAALDVLQAQHGPELPFAALAAGFAFRGRKVPFLNRAYGIYRDLAERFERFLERAR